MSVECVTGEYLSTSDLAIDGLNELSFGGWIRPYGTLFIPSYVMGNYSSDGYYLRVSADFVGANTIAAGVKTAGALDVVTHVPFTYDAWQHVIVTWKQNGSFKIYHAGVVDPAYITSASNNPVSSPAGTWVCGSTGIGSSNTWQGWLTDIAVWNRELSADEVYSLSRGFAAGAIMNGLIAWWPLNVPGDGIYHDVANGDLGCFNMLGDSPLVIAVSPPNWSVNNPLLHYASKPSYSLASAAISEIVGFSASVARQTETTASIVRTKECTVKIARTHTVGVER